jgi:hypothetical protein
MSKVGLGQKPPDKKPPAALRGDISFRYLKQFFVVIFTFFDEVYYNS